MDLASIFGIGRTVQMPPGEDGTPGKAYQMRQPTLIEQGRFSRWLEQRVHDAIDRGTEKPAEKDKRHDRAYTEAALGRYEYGGQYAVEALWTPAGMAKIFAIVCGVGDDEAEEVLRHKFKEVAAELIGRANRDPQLMAQVLASLGLPADWLSSSSSTPRSDEPSPNSGASTTTSSPSCTPSSGAPTG